MDPVEAAFRRFQSACRQETPPPLDALQAQLELVPPVDRGDLLVDLVAEHLPRRLQAGESARIEDYLARFGREFSDFSSLAAVPAELVEIEFVARHDAVHGDFPDLEDYARRFGHRPDVLDLLHTRCFGGARYVRLRVHEEGGFGRVWLAYDRHLRRQVALKEVHPARGEAPQETQRLEREARLAALLDHPAIITVHELSAGEPAFYVMRLVQGRSLDAVIRDFHASAANDPVIRNRLLGSFVAACDAVAFAHSRDVLHADLKPSNIVLGEFGETVVIDWGLARRASEVRGRKLDPEGTRAYMAPERWEGWLSEAGDVWALGAILREILTGTPPKPVHSPPLANSAKAAREPSAEATTRRLSDPPRLQEARPVSPPALAAVCRKAMMPASSERYASPRDLGADVARHLAGERVTAWREPWPHGVLRWFGHRRNLQVALVAAVTAALVILTVAVLLLRAALERETRLGERERLAAQKADLARNASLHSQRRMALTLAEQALRQGDSVQVRTNLEKVPFGRLDWEWRRLALQVEAMPRLRRFVGSHDHGIHAVVVDRERGFAVTSGFDGRVVQWDLAGGPPREWLAGPWDKVRRLGTNVAALAGQGEVPGSVEIVTALALRPAEGQVFGTTLSGKLLRWEPRSTTATVLYRGPNRFFCLAASREGLLAGDDAGGLTLFDPHGKIVAQRQMSDAVASVHGLNEKMWIAGSANGTVRIVRCRDLAEVQSWKLRGPIWAFDSADGGARLAVAAEEATLRSYRWDDQREAYVPDFAYVHGVVGASLPLRFVSVCWSRDGEQLLAGDGLGNYVGWKRGDQRPRFVVQSNVIHAGGADDKVLLPFRRPVAAIVEDSEDSVLIAGHGANLERWDLRSRSTEHSLQVGATSRFAFDTADPDLVWVGDSTGELTSRHLPTGRVTARIQTHQKAIVALEVGGREGPIVTAGADRTIRVWERLARKIGARDLVLRAPREIQSIALAPDHRSVAALTGDRTLRLWNLASGAVRLQSELPGDVAGPLPGLVRFRPDGKRLAICGPGPAFHLWSLDTNRLETVENQVVGHGGTALAWDPTAPDRFVSGDMRGRIREWPFKQGTFVTEGHPLKSPIAGLCFTPDGSRLASATVRGEVFLTDHRSLGVVLTMECEGPATGCQLQFDPSGRRLGLLRKSGELTVWDALPLPTPPPAAAATNWRDTVIFRQKADLQLDPRPNNFALDDQDRLWALLALPLPTRNLLRHDAEGEILLLHEGAPGGRPFQRWDGPGRGHYHALLHHEGNLYVALRDKSNPKAPRTRLFHSADGFRHAEDIIPEPVNSGGYLHLVISPSGRPEAFHHDFNGPYLVHSAWTGDRWQSRHIGRQGDGVGLQALRGTDGAAHLFFPSFRHGADQHPAILLRLEDATSREKRTLLGQESDEREGTLAWDPATGQVSVLLSRPNGLGAREYRLAQELQPRGNSTIRIDGTVSNHVVDRNGRTLLPYLDTHHECLCLAVHGPAGWTRELIRDLKKDSLGEIRGFFLLLDSRSSPVLIVLNQLEDHFHVRVFRPSRD